MIAVALAVRFSTSAVVQKYATPSMCDARLQKSADITGIKITLKAGQHHDYWAIIADPVELGEIAVRKFQAFRSRF
jgi:hypothetical protein